MDVSLSLNSYIAKKRSIIDEIEDIDEETLLDTLEGITDLPDLLAALLRSSIEDHSLAFALRDRLSAMRDRLTRLDERIEKKRLIVRNAMLEAGMKKMLQPDFTAYLRAASPSVQVLDETLIPAEYWIAQKPKLDKVGLLSKLRLGKEIPGATLVSDAMSLSVRTC